MDEYSLTLGAHLLWAFPLLLVVLVVAESVHDVVTRRESDS
jgi:cytochrome c-type biogenesis protein CcmH/NrfF